MLHMRVFEPDAKVFIIFKEWPMFYAYLIIDGVFKGLAEGAEDARALVDHRRDDARADFPGSDAAALDASLAQLPLPRDHLRPCLRWGGAGCSRLL